MPFQNHFVDIGLRLHVREWPGDQTPFVLLHGLSSNCRTWEAVAACLAAAGHRVVTVDQRGHGLSDKPSEGYDFATITADLSRLLAALSLEQPIVVGQSWGGNVVLEFGARYPDLARGLGFVDGGFLDLQARPNATWESVAAELRPPDLNGTPREILKQSIRVSHADWTDEGIEATLANFETLPDGTIRRQLDLANHMAILQAMWDQRPQTLYPQVTAPVLICVAHSGDDWSERKRKLVAAAQTGLPRSEAHWFPATDHDIHVHRPNALAELFLQAQHGIWGVDISAR
ncbi:MAG: alpha/beta hydrolase [Anaerolineales bacterium]|nr:alpha/beta hydrolase [Anaerolineales bacterium]